MLPQQPQTATRFQAVHRVRLNPAETKITVSGELGRSVTPGVICYHVTEERGAWRSDSRSAVAS